MGKQSGRRQARRKAFELLFELEQHPGLDARTILERTFNDPDVLDTYRLDEDSDGYVTIPVRDVDGTTQLAPQAAGTAQFVKELVLAVDEHSAGIDAELSKYPEDWSFERIGSSERILLRLAVAEMVYLGTSYKVVIDEVLDIAKLYAQEDATRFINGILGAVVRNLPMLRESATESDPHDMKHNSTTEGQ